MHKTPPTRPLAPLPEEEMFMMLAVHISYHWVALDLMQMAFKLIKMWFHYLTVFVVVVIMSWNETAEFTASLQLQLLKQV